MGLLTRLRGIVAARSLRGCVHVAPSAHLGWGVRIAVAPGGRVRIAAGARIGRRVRLEAGAGRIELAAGCRIGERCRLVCVAGPIELAAGAVLAERCTLLAAAGITIGERARLCEGASVIDFGPAFGDTERPIRLQGLRGAAVSVGRGAVVGPRAAIGPGTKLRADAQVAAGAILGHGTIASE